MTSGTSRRKRLLLVGLAAGASVLATTTLASAHDGDTTKVHGCIVPSSGYLRVIAPDESCKKGEKAVDWSTGDSEIAAGSITGENNNADVAAATGDLALRTVGRANLVAGAVDTAQIADRAVDRAKIAASAVGNTQIADEAVTTAKLEDRTVTSSKIANGQVGSAHLALGSVQGENNNFSGPQPSGALALRTVGRANLVDGAVDADQLDETLLGSLVTEAELPERLGINGSGPNDGNGFVHWTTLEGVPAGFADGTDDNGSSLVNQLRSDLASDDGLAGETNDLVSFSRIKHLDGRITGSFITNGTITAQDLATGAVGTDAIDDGAIRTVDLAGADHPLSPVPGAVTSEKILDETVETRDLRDANVTTDKVRTNLASTTGGSFGASSDARHGRSPVAASISIARGTHSVLLNGMASARCGSCASDASASVTFEWALVDDTGVQHGPAYTITLGAANPTAVLPVSWLVQGVGPGTHAYRVRVALLSGTDSVEVSNASLTAVDLGQT